MVVFGGLRRNFASVQPRIGAVRGEVNRALWRLHGQLEIRCHCSAVLREFHWREIGINAEVPKLGEHYITALRKILVHDSIHLRAPLDVASTRRALAVGGGAITS